MHYQDDDILAYAKEVADKLEQLEDVQRFKVIKAKLDQHEKIKHHISQIKQLQKQAVNLQAYGKTAAVTAVDKEIDAIQAEIDALPIVEEFKVTQVEVNAILQSLIGEINQQISDALDRTNIKDA